MQQTAKACVIPTGVPGDDFWLEFRDGYRWDAYIGGSGLVVYHIDKSSGMAGSMSAKLRWSANAVNGCAEHPCAMFVSSDGGTATSVADAFYPGERNVRSIHSSYNFALTGWNGKGIGLGLTDISRGADGIRCNLVADDGWDLPVVTGWSLVPGQTSAFLEWQSDKSSTGQWNLRWGILNGVSSETMTVGSQTSYLFEDLTPGESYFCEVYYTRWNVKGRVQRVEFSALNRLSDYPLIGGLDRDWHVGERFRLLVLNLPDDHASVSWRIDNLPCKDDSFIFKTAGFVKISATITYSDGSKEELTKILEVKDGN